MTAQRHIETLQHTIEPLRQQIINHPVYSAIQHLDHLKVFMQYHVYAVWDFMSLLKTLQNNLTCTTVPWFPVGSADDRFLINEIVVGEESDLDPSGNRKSHFELYLEAMRQSEADTSGIEQFITTLQRTAHLPAAFRQSHTPSEAIDFVQFTFRIIESNQPHLQAAVFTFGREDLIPQMFVSIINEIHKNFPHNISLFKYYIERHIEVDGGHHSHLALQMTNNLCHNDPQRWREAEEAVVEALQKRIALWDGVYRQLTSHNQSAPVRPLTSSAIHAALS